MKDEIFSMSRAWDKEKILSPQRGHRRRPRGSKSEGNEVNRVEMVAAKVFYKEVRAPGKRVSPNGPANAGS